MDRAVIVDGARTSFGRLGGELSGYPSYQLAGMVIKDIVDHVGLQPNDVDELILGIGIISSAAIAPARLALFEGGLPETVPSIAVDRACCSGMAAIGIANNEIMVGQRRAVLAGGMDSMSQTPWLLRGSRSGKKLGDQTVEDILLMRSPVAKAPIAKYVGEVALEYGVDREAQDRWALRSHQHYVAAADKGLFDEEIRVRPTGQSHQPLELDEQVRRDTSFEKLSKLKPVYGSPTVTPGNAPGLNDGAALVLVTSERYAESRGLQPVARILGHVGIAGAPTSSAYLPAYAIRQVLDCAGKSLKDVRAIEINEAFAATAPVSLKVLADGDEACFEELEQMTNVNGGAVAVGHPTGASGARVTYAAILEARRRGGGLAVASICGGFGQADAILLETL